MNKKGFYNQMMIVLILGIVLGAIVIGFFIFGLISPILISTAGTFGDVLNQTTTTANDGNLTFATQSSFTNAVSAVQQISWLPWVLFVFMILALIIMCFYVRTYPFLAFFWIVIVVLLGIISIVLTNAYQDIVNQGGDLANAYLSSTSSHYMLSYLPHIVIAIGIIGGIIMFMLASKDSEAEATPI